MSLKDEARFGDLVEFINGFAFSSDSFYQGGNSVIRISNIKDGGVCKESCLQFDNNKLGISSQFVVKKGDILIALSGATTGKIGVVDSESEGFYINQRVAIIRPKVIEHAEYILNVLQSDKLDLLLLDSEGSAQPNLSTKDIALMKTLGASGIKEFNTKSGKINSYSIAINKAIHALKQKLHHLDEYKTALIHNAVTKGLDANGCRILDKDLETDWISRNIKSLFSVATRGKNCTYSDNENKNLIITQSCILQDNTLDTSRGKYELTTPSGEKYHLKNGDILISSSGVKKTIGKVAYVEGINDSTIANWDVMRLVVSNGMCSKYTFYLLISMRNHLKEYCIRGGTGQEHLITDFFNESKVCVPDKLSQNVISSYIDAEVARLSMISDSINKKIALLNEYNKSLINEAVSGNDNVPENSSLEICV